MDENAKQQVVEETVDNSATDETDALIGDVIAEVEQEFEDEDLAALPDAEAQPDETTEVDAEAETTAEDASVEEEAEETDRSVERLVAREVELRTRENELKAKEAQYSHLGSENATLREQLAQVQSRIPENVDAIRHDPLGTLEAWGYDPEHVIQVALAQKLQKQGKPVPEALQRAIKDAEYDYKFKSIERREAQMAQQQKAREFVAKTEAEARQYIKAMSELKPEFSKDAPTVAKIAKADPERVFAEIMDEIGRDATAKARVPGAQLISFAEASRRVEKRWGEYRSLFSDSPAKDASTTADTTQARTQQTGASKQAGQTGKKVVKPITPAKPKTQEELEEEGLQAALAEYKRVEFARKKGTAPLRK